MARISPRSVQQYEKFSTKSHIVWTVCTIYLHEILFVDQCTMFLWTEKKYEINHHAWQGFEGVSGLVGGGSAGHHMSHKWKKLARWKESPRGLTWTLKTTSLCSSLSKGPCSGSIRSLFWGKEPFFPHRRAGRRTEPYLGVGWAWPAGQPASR